MKTMKNTNLNYPSRGFTLLEMFLVVVIMAAIGFVAARHYTSVSASSKASEVVLAVNHIRAATSAYSQDLGKHPDSVMALISSGYLANNYEKSPWGQRYLVGEDKSGKYGITVYNVPSSTLCKMIYNRLKASINPQSGEEVNYWDDSNGQGPAGGAGCTTVSATYPTE
jgi:type II secretory pathway pseudopilin PulG